MIDRHTLRATRSALARAVGTFAAATAAAAATAGMALAAGPHPYSIVVEKAEVLSQGAGAAQPATTARFGCELRPYAGPRLFCYGPGAIRKAYGIDSFLARGIDGTGQTIVIVDAYGSPTLESDLATFDAVFGLPPPPSLTQIHMPGSTPFDYADGNQIGWAEESSLDVQWAHAIAPGAKIILLAAKTNNDDDLLVAQNYAIEHELGSIISESFGEPEADLLQDSAGRQSLDDQEDSYKTARDAGISVIVSAGDDGSSANLNGGTTWFLGADYPASSPNVTSVGGTNLFFGTATNANPNGSYQEEVVWNDGYGAGGGGISGHFSTPGYERKALPAATLRALGGHRGYPDVAYNGGVVGGVLAYLGFLDAAYGPGFNGFYIFGGTSAGAPQWAGLTAVANQARSQPLGFLNPRLYKIAGKGGHDVVYGDNGFNGVPGYPATVGWDLSTGWGTPDIGLINALIASSDED
jgi:subtilase family serine protease